EATRSILQRVAREGDTALLDLARELDGVTLASLEVPRERRRQALAALDRSLRAAMERTAANLAQVHRAFLPAAEEVSPEPGIRVGRRPDPLARVGVYAPGGRATYPSSVLMAVVPARVAGVAEILVCSPPGRDGLPSPAVLAAAELAGADRVFAGRGAGAGRARGPAVGRVARRGVGLRRRVRARAPDAGGRRARSGACARAQRGHRVPGRFELGRLRRLHERRQPRAADRRARPLLLRALDARLRALDHLAARERRGRGRTGRAGGRLRRRRGAAGARRGGARMGRGMTPRPPIAAAAATTAPAVLDLS